MGSGLAFVPVVELGHLVVPFGFSIHFLHARRERVSKRRARQLAQGRESDENVPVGFTMSSQRAVGRVDVG